MIIMRPISEIMRERQLVIRRELDRRGIALKAIAFDSGIKYDTLLSYFPGGERPVSEMPISAAYSLCGVLPDDLINLLCPEGFAVVRVPAGVDYDDVNQHCMSFIAEKAAAHHPDSEEGERIGPNENASLAANVLRLRAA